jgi:hypothetical protein
MVNVIPKRKKTNKKKPLKLTKKPKPNLPKDLFLKKKRRNG